MQTSFDLESGDYQFSQSDLERGQHTSDSHFMRIALEYAWKFQALTLPNPCVGALIVWNNTIIALQAHQKAGMPHAEVLALKEAFLYKIAHDKNARELLLHNYSAQQMLEYPTAQSYLNSLARELTALHDSAKIHNFITEYHSTIFHDCELYVTLEPCNHYGKTPPCALLLETIVPKRIIIAHSDTTPHARGGITRLKHIPITQHILQKEAAMLLFPFLVWQKREQEITMQNTLQHEGKGGGFTLFKIAHRLHGDYKHGAISNHDSRIYTHNMRCVADYIIISGATLREDNPLLDTRFGLPPYTDNKSCQPKILILSKSMQQSDLKHYNIANKDAQIIRSVSEIPAHGFKVIEGGFAFLHSLLQEIKEARALPIDCIMGYISQDFSLPHTITHYAQNSKIHTQYALAYSAMLTHFWGSKDSQSPQEDSPNIIYYLLRKSI